MSIYPSNINPRSLRAKWDVAAIDVAVPLNLTSESADQQEWRSYLDCLSPAQQVRKFGQAIDQLHTLLEDRVSLTEEEQAKAFSLWLATTDASYAVCTRLMHVPKDYDNFGSDIERTIGFLASFLKDMNSPDAALWEQRGEKHATLRETSVMEIMIDKAFGIDKNPGYVAPVIKPRNPSSPKP